MLNTCWCTVTTGTTTSILKGGTAREQAAQCIWLLACQCREIFFMDLILCRVKCVLCQPPATLLNAAKSPRETQVITSSPPLSCPMTESDLNFCQGCTGEAKVTSQLIKGINHWKYSLSLSPMQQSVLLHFQLCNQLQLGSRKHWATPRLQIFPQETSRNWYRHLANLPTRNSWWRIQYSTYWAKASWYKRNMRTD